MPMSLPFFRNPFLYSPSYYNRYYKNYGNRYNKYYNSDVPNYNKTDTANRNENMQNNEKIKQDDFSSQENRSQNKGNTLFSFLPSSIGPLVFHPEALTNKEQPLFEMFGIHLYLDDIIIICILIFLYQEEVHDQMLYLCLFLLLIS